MAPNNGKVVWWIIGVLTTMLAAGTGGALVKVAETAERVNGLERDLGRQFQQLQRIESKLDRLLKIGS